MPGTITVPFEVMADGYSITGGRTRGIRATVPYLVAWSDAFTFYNQVLGYTRQLSLGGAVLVQLGLPFPPSSNIIASAATIQPIGCGAPLGTTLGLTPGEHFQKAIVTVEYEPPDFDITQLDPTNPLTFCEVEIDTGGQIDTIKSEGYRFDGPGGITDDSGGAVTGDMGKVSAQSRLVLTFPYVSFLPFQLVQGYIGTLNQAEMLNCDVGTLLFEDMKTKFAPSSNGIQGKQVQVHLAYQAYDWNMIPQPNGVLALVHKKGAAERIYNYTDLTQLFIPTEIF